MSFDYFSKRRMQYILEKLKTIFDGKQDSLSTAQLNTLNSGLTSSDKTKLDGIASGAEVNQNAFSEITVGSTTISADSKTDNLTLVAGSNITITPDATNDSISISATVGTDVDWTQTQTGGTKIAEIEIDSVSQNIYDSTWSGTHAEYELIASTLPNGTKIFFTDDSPDYADLDNKPSVNNVTLSGNKTSSDLGLANASDIPTELSDLSDDSTHRLVTDTEKSTWNGKQDALPTVVNDRYLHTNSTTGALEWSEVQGGGASSLNDLSDVTISSATQGQVLIKGSSVWENASLSKSDVGLGNVDNTSDLNKPISTATQTALDSKQNALPTVVNDRYLHTNSTTGALEWSEVQGGGTDDYDDLTDKPVVNGVTLQGSLTLTQLGICYTGTQAQYAQDASNIPVGCIVNITDDYNVPSISVINNLTSTSTTDALSANMGKYLNDNKADLSDIPQTIGSMNDVDITTPTNGQALLYDYANEVWKNGNISILPTVVNDRYLHTNSTTGALEWSEVQGGGASLPIDISSSNNVTGILNIANGGTGNDSGYVRAGQKANTTIGNYATAEGRNTTASGSSSHAEGYNTTASGDYSHAEGYNTISSGTSTHAEGDSTTASALTTSHAEGAGTLASGLNSHAEGRCTIAKGTNSHAQGKFNIQDDNDTYAHIVGNGTADNARSNAHTVDWAGNAWYAGTITDGTGNVLSNKQDKLPTVVNDRYLHTNATTGALEWTQVQGGGGSSATVLGGTLIAGDTELSFNSSAITATAMIDIYAVDSASIGYIGREVSGTTLTIIFPPQQTDVNIRVRIEETGE